MNQNTKAALNIKLVFRLFRSAAILLLLSNVSADVLIEEESFLGGSRSIVEAWDIEEGQMCVFSSLSGERNSYNELFFIGFSHDNDRLDLNVRIASFEEKPSEIELGSSFLSVTVPGEEIEFNNDNKTISFTMSINNNHIETVISFVKGLDSWNSESMIWHDLKGEHYHIPHLGSHTLTVLENCIEKVHIPKM